MPYQRILIPIDGSPPSLSALKEAGHLAAEQHARLRILYVLEGQWLYMPEGVMIPRDLDEALKEEGKRILESAATLAQQLGVQAETVLLESGDQPIPEQIVEAGQGWGADLLVLGTHGRHGIDRLLLGSVAERVARLATVPVMLVHDKLH